MLRGEASLSKAIPVDVVTKQQTSLHVYDDLQSTGTIEACQHASAFSVCWTVPVSSTGHQLIAFHIPAATSMVPQVCRNSYLPGHLLHHHPSSVYGKAGTHGSGLRLTYWCQVVVAFLGITVLLSSSCLFI
tara:strand:- start:1363 stop:1755 length:393 start_codon:yes stop_codon:yes gene_type:complete